MANHTAYYYLSITLAFMCFKSVSAIDCYQCAGSDSEHPFQCNEFLDSDVDLLPQPCDKIYGAKYCIKHVGRFEGGIGTIRYCSPFDLGNYCNYVSQPGDILEYRSCVYTCGTDGCNSATMGKGPFCIFILCTLFTHILYFFRR